MYVIPESEYIEHYGVLGMKWGVHKNPQKVIELANKKMRTLDKKVKDADTKASKKVEKAFESNAKAESAILFKGIKRFKASGRSRKASKALAKVQANKLKARKWAQSMDKVFSKAKVSNIDKEATEIGKKYANMTLEDISASNITINSLISSKDRYKTSWNR